MTSIAHYQLQLSVIKTAYAHLSVEQSQARYTSAIQALGERMTKNIAQQERLESMIQSLDY